MGTSTYGGRGRYANRGPPGSKAGPSHPRRRRAGPAARRTWTAASPPASQGRAGRIRVAAELPAAFAHAPPGPLAVVQMLGFVCEIIGLPGPEMPRPGRQVELTPRRRPGGQTKHHRCPPPGSGTVAREILSMSRRLPDHSLMMVQRTRIQRSRERRRRAANEGHANPRHGGRPGWRDNATDRGDGDGESISRPGPAEKGTAGTAPPHLLRISGARKSEVAVTGACLPRRRSHKSRLRFVLLNVRYCAGSDQVAQRREITRRGVNRRGLSFDHSSASNVGGLTAIFRNA